MDLILQALSHTMTTIAGQRISWIEAFGFVTGALCVWAVARQYSWNWPVGLLNNLAFLALFLGYGLYADAVLQVAFFGLGVYGWIAWSRQGRALGSSVVPIRRATTIEAVAGVAIAGVATCVIAFALNALTDSIVPWPDAFILAFSLLATWGQARKMLEQWWVWIAVDVVSIPLYAYKGLWLTALLYTGFLALCIYGLRSWTRQLRDPQRSVDQDEPIEVIA
ncbi:nicotinamide riboside transporter PnuC [Microbacterium sp. SS28]|uniref:nicotinamide riboside transporter PnuC n=1 Tax=Microbacterium sp. SS28 TaxID=2919948 RepID=UPI001FAB2A8C|nr:nicotinamide riboside transporter PnuC [Microbacterium sp. SS28]